MDDELRARIVACIAAGGYAHTSPIQQRFYIACGLLEDGFVIRVEEGFDKWHLHFTNTPQPFQRKWFGKDANCYAEDRCPCTKGNRPTSEGYEST